MSTDSPNTSAPATDPQYDGIEERLQLVNRYNHACGTPDKTVSLAQWRFVSAKMTEEEMISLRRLYSYVTSATSNLT